MPRARTPHERRKYDLARHHAWGGLAFLSIVMVLRILFPDIPSAVVYPLIIILVGYVLVWLCFTYRYRTELKKDAAAPMPPGGGVPRVDKAGMKLEKKRIKADLKARKKGVQTAPPKEDS